MNKSFVKCNANDFPITLTPQAPLALKAEVLHISKIFYVSPVDCSFFQSINDSPAHWFFFSLQVGRLAVSVFQCAGFLIILLIWSFCLPVCYSFHNFVHLSVRRSFVRFIRVSVGLHVCLFVRPAISLYISSFVCLSVGRSVSICLSVRPPFPPLFRFFFFTLLWHPILFNYFIYLATYAKLGSLLSLDVINSRVVIRIRIGNIRWQHPKHINIFCILLRVFVMRHCSIEINFRAERNSEILNHIVDP